MARRATVRRGELTLDIRYTHRCVIGLHHTDAAGVVFFGRLFTLAHDAYQAFMAERGLPLGGILRDAPYVLPVVHAEADFHAPLRVDDAVEVELAVERVGKTSFTLVSTFRTPAGTAAATVRTVHAAADRAAGGPVPLSDPLRSVLTRP